MKINQIAILGSPVINDAVVTKVCFYAFIELHCVLLTNNWTEKKKNKINPRGSSVQLVKTLTLCSRGCQFESIWATGGLPGC